MAQYYYLIASFPMISFESDPPYTIEEFQETSLQWLTGKDRKVFQDLISDEYSYGSDDVLDKWVSWDTALRNEISRIRSQKKGMDQESFVRTETGGWTLTDAVKEVFAQGNPYEAEEMEERIRWGFLSELEAPFYFQFDRVLVYYLKLLLLIRKSKFTKERGGQRFDGTYRTMAEPFTQTRAGEQ